MNSCKFKSFILLLMLIPISSPSYSQISGIERRFGTSNKSTFTYQVESTIGTRTSAAVTGNMHAETSAVLNLGTGSKISNKIGDVSGNTSAVFVGTPNGASVNLQGITGENIFLIKDGTQFQSSLRTKDNENNLPSTGEASSYAVQNTRVTVQKTNSSLINAFQQSF